VKIFRSRSEIEMIVAGHQPNYLPWLGFFDKLRRCDVFIIEDNIQYEQQGFTNRNRIKTPDGVKWLTVPIEHQGHPLQINEVRISNDGEPSWAKRHWLSLMHNYCKAPFWEKYCGFFEQTYSKEWEKLFDLNLHLIKGLMSIFNLDTPLVMASSLNVFERKNDGVVAKCKILGADILLCGNGAKGYIDLKQFDEEGIKVIFQDFRHPTYRQLYGKFVNDLSVVDYLFCNGPTLNKLQNPELGGKLFARV
jgi:hypothetical protein